MWAFEAAVALGLARDQLRCERLLAVRADDLLWTFLGGEIGHESTVPAKRCVRPADPPGPRI